MGGVAAERRDIGFMHAWRAGFPIQALILKKADLEQYWRNDCGMRE
jgi:hypothetical protein